MSQSLAVKYRPVEFEDICGQKSIVKILKQQLATGNVAHSYLFCGSSGCGKTTSARAFAKAVNHGVGNPIEIDAASNNGVDNIKELVRNATERSLDSTYKVIILDEAHSLTPQSWQALLKCIEEPPEYTIFIFCTTEKNKVPNTIKNRCQVFNFNRIPSEVIAQRLKYICSKEGVTNYTDACDYISRVCSNQMRDGISLLEKCLSYRDSSDLSVDCVLNAIGDYSYDNYFDLFNAIIDGDESKVLFILNSVYNSGIDLKLFVDEFLSFILDLYKYTLMRDIRVTKFPSTLEDKVKYSIGLEGAKNILSKCLDCVMGMKNAIKQDANLKSTVEVLFLDMVKNIC